MENDALDEDGRPVTHVTTAVAAGKEGRGQLHHTCGMIHSVASGVGDSGSADPYLATTVEDADARWHAFESEAMPHVDRLFRHAMWLERNRTEAEDLVQETLVQALQSFHRFAPGTNCGAWLLTIMQHVRANRQRKQRRVIVDSEIEERAAHTVPFVPPLPDHITDEDMLRALEQISERYQEVILLCDVEEMTYKEIAAALDIPIGTVMSRLHRGRELLRVELARTGATTASPGKDTGTR